MMAARERSTARPAGTRAARRGVGDLDVYLERLAPAAARSYLAAYERAGLPLPLNEHQAALVRAAAARTEAAA